MIAAPAVSEATRRAKRLLASGLILLLIVSIFAVPYVWMAVSGFKSQYAIFQDVNPLNWRAFVPTDGTLANYLTMFVENGIGRALLNSFIIAGIQVFGALVVCSMAAYALTRINFRGRSTLFALILITFMLPAEAMVVPMYSVISGLSLQDTLVGVAIPWVANVFGLFLLRQHFEEVPTALDEAARLDGAGHIRIFWSIILPNVKTALATLCLVMFLFSWNSFLWPLVVTQSPETQPVQVNISQSVAPGEFANWGLTFAGATIATIPLILLFLALQRYFVRGLSTSGLK